MSPISYRRMRHCVLLDREGGLKCMLQRFSNYLVNFTCSIRPHERLVSSILLRIASWMEVVAATKRPAFTPHLVLVLAPSCTCPVTVLSHYRRCGLIGPSTILFSYACCLLVNQSSQKWSLPFCYLEHPVAGSCQESTLAENLTAQILLMNFTGTYITILALSLLVHAAYIQV